jgi:peptidoglycan hydrolase-like protein with peptidoglycan-binding domain
MRLRTSITAGLALLLTAGTAWSATSTPRAARSSAKPAASGASKSRGKRSRHSSRRERGQKAPAPERISEIQQALAKDGSFSGKPSGKWDDSTVEAMKKFQAGHGLNPSGKLDAVTLQKLGLGSQTAGVAAPMPPVAASLLATKPAQVPQRQ